MLLLPPKALNSSATSCRLSQKARLFIFHFGHLTLEHASRWHAEVRLALFSPACPDQKPDQGDSN
jgi:hypothetical protein